MGETQDAPERDSGLLRHSAYRPNRAFEQDQHDLVVDDEHRSQVAEDFLGPVELGDGRSNAVVELAKVLLMYAGPEALGDVAGQHCPAHVPDASYAEITDESGFPLRL